METVLITGATSGIGKAITLEFAKRNYKLILVARTKNKLEKIKRQLSKKISEERIEIIDIDLAREKAGIELYSEIKRRGLRVNILVNNAGIGLVGEELELSEDKENNMLNLNIKTLTELTHLFMVDMRESGKGKILNVASVGAFQPGPYTAAYYASKSYVLSYSRAVRIEASKYNIQVSVLCPGSTKTDFFDRAGVKVPLFAMDASKVAKEAYRGLMENREIIIPGRINRIMKLFPVKIKMLAVAFVKAKK